MEVAGATRLDSCGAMHTCTHESSKMLNCVFDDLSILYFHINGMEHEFEVS